MTIQLNLISQIRGAQLEALMEENINEEGLRGMERLLEIKDDGMRYFMNRVWVLKFREVKELVQMKLIGKDIPFILEQTKCIWRPFIGGQTLRLRLRLM